MDLASFCTYWISEIRYSGDMFPLTTRKKNQDCETLGVFPMFFFCENWASMWFTCLSKLGGGLSHVPLVKGALNFILCLFTFHLEHVIILLALTNVELSVISNKLSFTSCSSDTCWTLKPLFCYTFPPFSEMFPSCKRNLSFPCGLGAPDWTIQVAGTEGWTDTNFSI